MMQETPSDKKNSPIVIIGAGIAGLTLAWKLKKAGMNPTLIESSDQVGGAIRTVREEGYVADLGPNTLLLKDPEVKKFLEEDLELKSKVTAAGPGGKNRFILRRGRVVALPSGPGSAIFGPYLSPIGKLRALLEPVFCGKPAAGEESVAAFMRRHFGEEVLQTLVDPFVSGIFAGDPEKLSIRETFPPLVETEKQHRSIILGNFKNRKKKSADSGPKPALISFTGGLGTLVDTLREGLGDSLSLKTSIHSIERENGQWKIEAEGPGGRCEWTAQRLVLATNARGALGLPLPGEVAAPLGEALKDLPLASLVSVALGFPREAVGHPLDGFGFLIPHQERKSFLGCLFPSSLFPSRAPDGKVLLHVFAGGARHPEAMDWDDPTLLQNILPELRSFLNISHDPDFCRIIRWPDSIPQTNVGHHSRRAAMEALEEKFPGLHLAGSYRYGIAVPQCIRSSLDLADRLGQEED